MMAEALEKTKDLGNWTSSLGGTSTMKTVLFDTSLILILSTVAIYFSSAIQSMSWSWKMRREGRSPLPPGSLGLPFLGETLSFLRNRPSFLQSRHAKHGPIFKSNVMGNMVFLQAPASNKFLFSNENKLVKMHWPTTTFQLLGKHSMFVKTGEEYKRSRRHINPLFSPGAVEKYVPRIEQKVGSNLAEFWQPSRATKTGFGQENEFELAVWDSVNKIAFEIALDLILSLGPDDAHVDLEEMRHLFAVWSNGLAALPIKLPGTLLNRAMKARERILAILERLIAKRKSELEEGKATPSQDFLSYLLTEPGDNGELMSHEELKDTLLLFVNAGHATSSHTMTLTLRSIALHPDVYDLMRKEHDSIAEQKGPGESLTKEDLAKMKYTWCVIQESLRILSPVGGGFREMTTDVELEGFTVPKGWKMFWSTKAHMDPRFFEKPATFDPTRFDEKQDIPPYTYTPFGGGVRICPGNDFAKMEMLIYMHCVVKNYRFTLVDPDEPILYAPFPYQKSGTLMRIRKLR